MGKMAARGLPVAVRYLHGGLWSNLRNTKQKDMNCDEYLFYSHSCRNLKSKYRDITL